MRIEMKIYGCFTIRDRDKATVYFGSTNALTDMGFIRRWSSYFANPYETVMSRIRVLSMHIK